MPRWLDPAGGGRLGAARGGLLGGPPGVRRAVPQRPGGRGQPVARGWLVAARPPTAPRPGAAGERRLRPASAPAGGRRVAAADWLTAGRRRSGALDRRCAIALHRRASHPLLLWLLRACSTLADGPLWLSLLLLLPLFGGEPGVHCAQLVALVGSIDLAIYWAVKRGTRRLRPFHRWPDVISARARAPDRFSFPSGHTLHATAFALLLSTLYPSLAPLLWGFAALVGASRVVLGLHYPSDVLAGALIGVTVASGVMAAFGPALPTP